MNFDLHHLSFLYRYDLLIRKKNIVITDKYCLYLSKYEHQIQTNEKLKTMHITYIRRSSKILLKLIFRFSQLIVIF